MSCKWLDRSEPKWVIPSKYRAQPGKDLVIEPIDGRAHDRGHLALRDKGARQVPSARQSDFLHACFVHALLSIEK